MWEDIKELLGVVLFIALLFALSCGVTVNGKRYEADCNTKNGLEFKVETVGE